MKTICNEQNVGTDPDRFATYKVPTFCRHECVPLRLATSMRLVDVPLEHLACNTFDDTVPSLLALLLFYRLDNADNFCWTSPIRMPGRKKNKSKNHNTFD